MVAPAEVTLANSRSRLAGSPARSRVTPRGRPDPTDPDTWVKVAPPGATGTGLLLARAVTPEQQQAVGAQAGGRVFLFLETSDFARDYRVMLAAGVEFTERPRHEPYGAVVVFRDLYGNRWDLVEARRSV